MSFVYTPNTACTQSVAAGVRITLTCLPATNLQPCWGVHGSGSRNIMSNLNIMFQMSQVTPFTVHVVAQAESHQGEVCLFSVTKWENVQCRRGNWTPPSINIWKRNTFFLDLKTFQHKHWRSQGRSSSTVSAQSVILHIQADSHLDWLPTTTKLLTEQLDTHTHHQHLPNLCSTTWSGVTVTTRSSKTPKSCMWF